MTRRSTATSLVRIVENAGLNIARSKVSPHGLQPFPSGFRDFLWHVEFQEHHHITSPTAPLSRKTALSQFNGLARVGIGWHLDHQRFPVKMFQLHRRPQDQIGITKRERHDEVRTRAFEPLMLFNVEFNE